VNQLTSSKIKITVISITFLLLAVAVGRAQTREECLACHSDPDFVNVDSTGATISLYVNESLFDSSAHGAFECIDCHSDIQEIPHAEKLSPVNCAMCHDQEADVYKWHGRLKVGVDPDIPDCSDCHGTHDIFHSTDNRSKVNPLNLPHTCGNCHENLNIIKKHDILVEKPILVYENSVHGKATQGGLSMAASCNDCHSADNTAHKILYPGNKESSINHFNIPYTCGKCHNNIENDYWAGIHGKLTARGETDSPVCTDCHGEHGILSPSDPRSPVSPTRVAEATCSPCHESARLNEKYDIPTGRLKTWVDSYHGLKSRAGDITVANCASCHGAHKILPHSDPASSINKANLQKTCGHCHPGISATIARSPIHGTPGISSTPIANIIAKIYIVAIIVIIGTMLFHWLIDLRKQISDVLKKKQVRRMNLSEVWQHALLTISFIVLVITGFSLRFSDAGWVKFLFGWEGGFPLRGIIHRVAAVVLIFSVVWHAIYLLSRRGRKIFKDIFPTWTDLRQFFQMVNYNLGLSKKKPAFGRFSYVEKAEYWALVWGSIVMIVSGFFLWFENVAVRWFAKGFLDVMLVVHYYEAWLAALAILIWHMYSTIFNPSVYPMNPSWITGKMPEDMFKHEHPQAPNPDDEDVEVKEENPPESEESDTK